MVLFPRGGQPHGNSSGHVAILGHCWPAIVDCEENTGHAYRARRVQFGRLNRDVFDRMYRIGEMCLLYKKGRELGSDPPSSMLVWNFRRSGFVLKSGTCTLVPLTHDTSRLFGM